MVRVLLLTKLSCREPGLNLQPLYHEPSTESQSHKATKFSTIEKYTTH